MPIETTDCTIDPDTQATRTRPGHTGRGARRTISRHWLVWAAAVSALAVAWPLAGSHDPSGAPRAKPVAAQAVEYNVHMPVSSNKGPFVAGQPLASATPGPTATTPSGTARPTGTNTPPATLTPPPEPTLGGGRVEYRNTPSQIVMQIGFTGSDEPDMTGEELNGTPWFTLYGDGTVIVGHEILDNEQPLYTVKVDDAQMQLWLRELVHGVRIDLFAAQPYSHPAGIGRPTLHVYLDSTELTHGVHITDFTRWEREPVLEHSHNTAIRRLIALARNIEAWAEVTATDVYVPQAYTLLVRKPEVPVLPGGQPPWTGLDIRPIAARAPRAGAVNIGLLPGHHFTDRAEGEALRALIEPEWRRSWSVYGLSAEFRLGDVYWIALRKEVPGQSYFLPSDKRAQWYRRDDG
jgi:hypothetical protein